jgi:hypothetical protein
MGDCHSFDPGSKFGLKKPNERPGPGAYTFSVFQIQALRIYNKTKQTVTVLRPRRIVQYPTVPAKFVSFTFREDIILFLN